VRLISWNVEHRISSLGEQVAALLDRGPDIVALQEVTVATAPKLRELLAGAGLAHAADSTSLASTHGRRYGQLVASLWPLRPLPPVSASPFPERVLSVTVDAPFGEAEIHVAHVVPGSRQGWRKIEMLRAIYHRLAGLSLKPRILCGDFNEPQAELPDGEIVTSRHRTRRDGSLVVRRGRSEEWERGVRSVLEGLAEFDLPDVYRSLHGPAVVEFSHVVQSTGRGYRYDHVFASRALNPVACRYLHEPRERGLSDHSAIEADFNPGLGAHLK
jgi:endonuclease/exonuclease/phosphatase family metal-dependent hydrolase